MRIKLVLLYGGKSGEHEISLTSAASVFANLDREKYSITPIGMDKEGQLFIHDDNALRTYKDALPVRLETSIPLDSLMKNGRFALDADVVFPVVHGPMYEDGCLQGLLELCEIAYVGCGVLSSAVGMDKDISRQLVMRDGIDSTRYRKLSAHVGAHEIEAFCRETAEQFGWPLFVKPLVLGSSVGIHKVHTLDECIDAVNDARRYDESILLEAFVKGREIELAVLEGGSEPKVSVPGEICVHHADGFYSYRAKYLESEQTELLIPAPMEASLIHELQQASASIFTRLQCQGMARIDFFVDEKNKIYFNEINTLPGFTAISMYPKLWEKSGLPYTALLDKLVSVALLRQEKRRMRVTHYQ